MVNPSRLRTLFAFLAVVGLFAACGAPAPPAAESEEPAQPETQAAADPADAWWEALSSMCGSAFAGTLVSTDEADADLAGQPMVMHVRRCSDERLEIPFHIGENRSRTWVLTRTAAGIQLQHDHRHEDGESDTVTLYGGLSERGTGTATALDFPVDDYSKQLFEANGLTASVVNVWTMEVVPGTRFSYILRRPERHFQADFDLSAPVPAPPAPWGHS